MKYNLTNETYLPETISNFPGAPSMTFIDMLTAAIFYNLLPLLISFISYYPIVWLFRKAISNHKNLRILVTGLVLSGTTPLFYLWASGWKHNDYYQINAETIGLLSTLAISTTVYWLFNKNDKLKPYNMP